MIHYKENDDLIMEGTVGELLSEVGIIDVHVIQQMIECGMSKSNAITKFYEVLEISIKVYESEGIFNGVFNITNKRIT